MNKIQELREIIAKRVVVPGNFDVSNSTSFSTASVVTIASASFVSAPYTPLQWLDRGTPVI
jgi:hypothetical protein